MTSPKIGSDPRVAGGRSAIRSRGSVRNYRSRNGGRDSPSVRGTRARYAARHLQLESYFRASQISAEAAEKARLLALPFAFGHRECLAASHRLVGKEETMTTATADVFGNASKFDLSLRPRRGQLERLQRKRLRGTPYSRQHQFQAAMSGARLHSRANPRHNGSEGCLEMVLDERTPRLVSRMTEPAAGGGRKALAQRLLSAHPLAARPPRRAGHALTSRVNAPMVSNEPPDVADRSAGAVAR